MKSNKTLKYTGIVQGVLIATLFCLPIHKIFYSVLF